MEKKQEKQQIEPKPETAKFFQRLISASIDGILVTDETQNIIVANESFCSFFGQVPVNILETNLLDWLKRFHDDCVRDWTEVDKNVHLKGSCHTIEFKMRLPHETRYFSINASIRERLYGKEIHELIMPERFIKRHQEGFKAFRDTGAGPVVGKTVELAALRKDGNEFPIELSVSAMQIRGEWHATIILLQERENISVIINYAVRIWKRTLVL